MWQKLNSHPARHSGPHFIHPTSYTHLTLLLQTRPHEPSNVPGCLSRPLRNETTIYRIALIYRIVIIN